MYSTFDIKITIINDYPFIDFSPNTPILLTHKIKDLLKDLIKDYFKN